jgi:hypothetical protein
MSFSGTRSGHKSNSAKALRRSLALSAAMIETLEKRQLLTASWTALTIPAPQGIHAMTLLSNGDVMAQFGEDIGWAILTPSSTGSYINGTWTQLSNMHDTRIFYSTQLLDNGNLFVAGGEYGSGASNAEVYNTLTNTWTQTPAANYGEFGDSNSEILANGDVMIPPIYPTSNGLTGLYNPTTNTWSQGPTLYRGSDADEQTWIKLADGSILTSDGSGSGNTATSERYIPATNSWVNDGTIPVSMWDGEGEIGAGALLPNGKVFLVGSTGNTAIYTPSGYNSSDGIYTPNGSTPGTWTAGPTIPGGLGEDDAPVTILPDGTVLLTGGPADSYSGPTSFFIFNASANTITPLTAAGNPDDTGGPDGSRFLDLPDGTVLLSTGSSTLYDFNPGTTPLTAPDPTITSIAHNSDGSYLLTGTMLNGNSEGAVYGDDAQMNSNYPIVKLTSSGGTVYFARTYEWSSTGVDTGALPETTDFTLPAGLPAGTYSVNVMVNGFVSGSSSITTPASTDTAPTVSTAASASPATVTGLTTTLSVAAAGGTAPLTYNWLNTSAPSGDSTASFSANANSSSNSVIATFQQAGDYTFKVTITDALGLSTTSTVSVVVNQTLTSDAISYTTNSLTSGQTEQLTATGYDQFGNSMATQPSFTWNVSGGGTVSASGLYTTPGSGTLATVNATTGSLVTSATMYVVSAPWISADIGSPGVAGTAFNTGGTFNVSGSGSDVWGTSDQFHYVYQPLGGNGVIIAEVDAEPNPLTTWEKAGVMIRNTLDASSQQAFMAITPGNGAAFQYRPVAGGSSDNDNTAGPTAPYWVKLVRNGSTFTGYYSANGTTWTKEASTTITMTGTAYIGLFIVSQSNSAASIATFSNISLVDAAPDSLTVNAGTPASINVLANDTGPSGATLTLTSVSTPTKGTLTFNSSGGITYNASASSVGTETLTYNMSDGLGDTATGTLTITINGLQAYYHFNEDTGTTSADATGDGYTATLVGATWTTAGTDGTDAITFSGSNYATIPALNLNSNTITMSGWINDSTASENADAGIIFNRGADGSEGNGLDFYNTTTLGYTWGTDAATYSFNSGLTPTAGTWTFVALVITPTAATIYMEPLGGTLKSKTDTLSEGLPTEPFSTLTGLGEDPTYGSDRDFQGSMDEVRIYNINLSSSAIATLANLSPSIVNAAAASPSPATGTTDALSVAASDYLSTNVLTYTWTATTIPTGATTPIFSGNGTSNASSTTATLYKAGSYVFKVTVADAAGLSNTSRVSLTVSQTPTSIVITPTSASLASHGSQTFTAVEDDQFGNAISSQPAFSWSSTGSGSVNASTGVYTGGYATGTATVTATAGTITKNATVTLTNTAPVISSAASASPASVAATTANLTVSATDDGGSDLTYSWATTGTPPAGVAFSANNTNTSNATTATFTKAGSYTLQVTVTDAGGLSTTSSVVVTVNQTLTTAVVSPATTTLHENATQAFTATGYDQFGNALSSQPAFTWTKTAGVGSINSGTGVYTSPASTGTATLLATSGSVNSSSASITINNAAPTIATPASAAPSPVTGTTAALSVLGADDGGESNLTYTWAATAMPNGAAAPTYSSNGVNASRNSTATFYQAGTYTFTVTVSDGQGGTTSSSVNVTVNQTLTTITVSPSSTTIAQDATQTFTAGAYDQFGTALSSQPTFSWSKTAGIGSINASTGVYTAPASTGTATITATSASITGNASVTVQYTGPSIVTAAAATPSPVTGTTTALSVLGTEPAGESNLSYTWSATSIPAGATTPIYSINGTNAAKNTTATFYQAGSYTFLVTVTDGQSGSTTSSVNVTVNQTLTAITLSSTSVVAASTSQATANDQFGNALSTTPGWSLSGGGSINSAGLFTAGSAGGTFTITATSGNSVNTGVTVVPTAYAGSSGNDTYTLRVSPTNPSMEQIFVNTPETGSPTYTVAISQLPSLSFNTASDGTLTLDFANGNPLPSGGITYNGSGGGGSGLYIEGSAAGGLAFSINASKVTDTADASSPITYTSVGNIELDLAGGSNTLTQLAQPAAAVTFNAGPGNNTLNVSGGSYSFSADPALTSGSLTVNDNAAVVFTAPTAGSGYNARNLAALNIGSAATATLTPSTATTTDRTVLETGGLSITTGGTLDIGNNAVIVHGGDLPAITSLIKTGFNAGSGYWNGVGITSTSARTDTTLLTAVGVISNNISGVAIDSTFDNQPVSASDVLIKFTYYGDATLDGKVDGSDYSRIDSGYLTYATGWFNGDFNYDGSVDGSDYTLIDNAFNAQGQQQPKQNPAPTAVNPIAYYKFNDGVTATTASDSTGNGYTAAIHGATATTGVDDTTGLSFNGTSDYVSLPSLNLTSNTITLSGWVETNGTQTTGAGIIDNNGNGLTITAGNRLSYSWGNNASTTQFNSSLIIPDDQWTFVALTVNPTGATLYMQPEGGEMSSATSNIPNPAESFKSETDLGKNGSAFFNGSMDEVRVYDQSLSYEQILTVADLAPVITSPAASLESAEIAIQTELSVAATSQAGASNLIYTWSATSAPYGATVSFSDNGTNSAYDTIATGTIPGDYVFTVTVTDPGHLSTTSSVSQTFGVNPLDIAEINYPPAPPGGGIQPLNLGSFVVDSRTPDDFNSNDNAADRYVYIMDSLTIVAPYSQIDIGNNDLIIHSSSAADALQTYETVNGYVNSGYGQGGAANWTYPGIISSLAANAGLGRSAITVILNVKSNGQPIYTTFDGQPVTATDVLVRYNG